MIFQANVGWGHEITEWVAISVTMIIAFWGFKRDAKKDTERRHEENKKAQQETAEQQKQILEELQAERKYLPQHWHGEWTEGMQVDRPLTTFGIQRRPKNGT